MPNFMPGRNIFLLAVSFALFAVVACGSSQSDGEAPASAAEPGVALDSTVNVIDEEALQEFTRLAPVLERVYDERLFYQAVPPDAIVPIYEPKFVEQNEIEIWPGEMVMGVEINGEAHAYPIGLMRKREIVNDVVGGVPILVTWCPLCFTGLAHDRRLDGEVMTFGNQGALFMTAMTWFDHATESVWSQPWGSAITGPLAGKSLTQIPSEVLLYGAWLERHPDTKVLIDERGEHFGRQLPNNAFVIGVAVQDAAVGFYFPSAKKAGLINHQIGEFPVAVFVNEETGAIDVYLRRVVGSLVNSEVEAPEQLTFERDETGAIRDIETGSVWNIQRGLAIEGPLRGAALQSLPYTSAFDWAWEDFYPGTELWGEKPIVPLPEFYG